MNRLFLLFVLPTFSLAGCNQSSESTPLEQAEHSRQQAAEGITAGEKAMEDTAAAIDRLKGELGRIKDDNDKLERALAKEKEERTKAEAELASERHARAKLEDEMRQVKTAWEQSKAPPSNETTKPMSVEEPINPPRSDDGTR